MQRKLGLIVLLIAVLMVTLGIHFLRKPKSPWGDGVYPQCKIHLKIIREIKDHWCWAERKTTNDTPTWEDLMSELEGSFGRERWTNNRPICPKGGIYTLEKCGEYPRCSIGGTYHSLQ